MSIWTSLRDLFVGGPPLIPQAEPERWQPWRPQAPNSQAPGLTVGRIAAALREADEGFPARFCELMEDMEDRDPVLVSDLATRKAAVVGRPWAMEPSGDGRRARKVADFVRDHLLSIENLEDGLLDLLDAVPKGYGVVELRWYNRNGVAGIESLDYRPQRWFKPSPDNPEEWRLLEGDPEGTPLAPYRFLIHTSKAKSGFPTRAALGRVLAWWYLFSITAVRDWAGYSELFGAPLRLGKYPAGSKPKDIDALQAALVRLGVDSAACIPSDMVIDFVGDKSAKTGPDVYERLIAMCDKKKSQAILGQNLTSDAGNSGSRALGQVHNEVRRDLMVRDARQLAATLNRGLVRPLVAWNFGPNEPLPRFVFDVEPPEDEKVREDTREVRGRVFKQAKELGVPVSVEQVQAELGIRPPRAGETLLVAMADRPVLVATNVAPVRTHALSDAPDLDQLEEVIRRFEESGKGVWADFIADVQTRLGQAKTLEEVDALLLRAVRELEPGLLQQVLLEATLTGELMGRLHAGNNDLPVADLPKVPPAEAIDWWAKKEVVSPSEYAAMEEDHRGRAFTIAQFTSASALLEAKGHLDRVIAEGGTLSDFEDGLEEIYKRTGMEPLDPWRLYTVFHTNTASAYNAGRWTQQQRPETLARRPFLQLLTMEDSHVRVSHSAMHGFVAAADSPIWDVWYPPNGFGCRCKVRSLSAEDIRRDKLAVRTDLPTSPATGRPLLPDDGFRRNPAKEAHQFDWSAFPSGWRQALGV